jgi:hypothetical protein
VGLFLCLTIFLFEDQERGLQSILEEWWIRLAYGRDQSLTHQARFARALAASTTNFLDMIFSKTTFSLQAISASICYSTGVLFLFIASYFVFIMSIPHDIDSGMWGSWVYFSSNLPGINVYRTVLLFYCIALLSISAPLAPLFRPNLRWLPVICALIVGAYCVWLNIPFFGSNQPEESQNPTLAFPITILCQLYAIAVTRRVLRLSAKAERLSYICVLLILNIIGLALLIAIPFALYLTTKVLIMYIIAVMNLSGGVLLGAFLCLACVMLLHHFLWPFLLRPLYLLQRVKFLHYKKACVGIGVACIAISWSPRAPFAAIKDLVTRYLSQ